MKQSFYQTSKLFYFYVKRNSKKMILWVVLLTALTLMIPPAFESMYPSQSKMSPIIEMSKNPAMQAMLGPADFEHVNIGVLFTHEMTLFTAIMVAIMNILIVSRGTRGDEEDGRIIILTALPIGKQAPLMGHLLQTLLLNVSLMILLTLGLTLLSVDGIDLVGAFLYSSALGVFGIMFAALTMLVAQFVSSSSETTGVSIALLLIMYLVRAFGDVANETLSMFSPMGWLSRTYAFSEDYWWPVWCILGITVIFVISAFVLNGLRDIEAKLLPQKKGKQHAKSYMKSPLGLQIKLQKMSFIYFAIGLFILGLSYGSIFGNLDDFFKDNPLLLSMLENPNGDYVKQFLPQLMLVMAIISTVPTLLALFKIKKSIDKGYAMLVLANPISRIKYLLSFLIISVVNAVVMIFVAGLGLYAGQFYSMDTPLDFDMVIQSAIVYIPAILSFVGIGTVVIGWGIKLTTLVYAYLAYTFLVNYLGTLLNVKDWMKDITPFEHIPSLPIDDFTSGPIITLLLIFIILCVIGVIGFNRKDI